MLQWAKFMRPCYKNNIYMTAMYVDTTYMYSVIYYMVGDTTLTHNEGTKYTDLN